MAEKTPRKYDKFSAEFREQSVRLVTENSRAIAQVARELGVHEGTLRNWVNQYRAAHADDEPPMTPAERVQLAEAQREAEWSCDSVGWLAEVVADLAAGLGVGSPLLLTVTRAPSTG